MEEKRNLQKLIFSDISAAGEKYRAARKQAREELQERLIEKAPSAVVALFAEHKNALATVARVEKELSETGYALSGYGAERSSRHRLQQAPAGARAVRHRHDRE